MTEKNLEKANSITQMLMQFRREREVVARMSRVEIYGRDQFIIGWANRSQVTFSKDSGIDMVGAVREVVLARLDRKIAYYIDQLELL